MSDDNDFTLLVLEGDVIGITPYSARGLTQTYAPIAQAADLKRSINGTLRNRGAPQFKKYSTKITCSDVAAPAFDGAFPGDPVTVSCVFEFSYPVGGTPTRTAVSSSERTDGSFNYYRPVFNCLVTNFSQQLDEYGAVVGWELDLEEE